MSTSRFALALALLGSLASTAVAAPPQWERILEKAMARERAGDIRGALRGLKAAFRAGKQAPEGQRPDPVRGRALQGYLFSRAGRWDMAVKAWERAARGGDPLAQLDLGRVLLAQAEDDVAEAEAMVWVRKAAKAGHPDAHLLLAGCYREGACGLSRDPERAALASLDAAQAGSARGAFDVGVWFMGVHEGSPRDATAAARWLHLSAARGYGPALALLKDEAVLAPTFAGGAE
jgi:TPR repeat protein